MSNVLGAAILLLALSAISFFVMVMTGGATSAYAKLLLSAFLAATSLVTLLYFLLTRRGKDRII